MAGWPTSWILEEPLWLLTLLIILPWIFYLSRRPTLEVKLPWGFLCPLVHADHQPARRGKLNWIVFILASTGAFFLIVLMAMPRSSEGKVFLFQPQWLTTLKSEQQKTWLEELTSTWPKGITPSFYSFKAGPFQLESIGKILGDTPKHDSSIFYPEDFSIRVHPRIGTHQTFKGDLLYPHHSEVSIQSLAYLNPQQVLLQLTSPSGVKPSLHINDVSKESIAQHGLASSYILPLSETEESELKITLPAGGGLPSLRLAKRIPTDSLPAVTHILGKHPPLADAYKSIPWNSLPSLTIKNKGIKSLFNIADEPLNTPSGLPLQATSSSLLPDQDEHLGFNWPLKILPQHVLPRHQGVTLFSIGAHPIVTRPNKHSLPWTTSFDPLSESIFSPAMERHFWKLLLKSGFPRHWNQTPLQPDSPPLQTPDGKPQEVHSFPRFLLWVIGLCLISMAILLHHSTIPRTSPNLLSRRTHTSP